MYTPEQIAKIRWNCRRGMLELDVILLPFVDQYFSTTPEGLQSCFVTLLEEADPDIFSWLMGYSKVPAQFAEIIDFVKTKHYQL